MVVFSHASGMGLHVIPGVSLSGMGKYGVYLFFAISAYLLTAQWLRSCELRQLGPYLARRFLRIYPLYLTVLLVGWWLAPPTIPVPRSASEVGLHLLLLRGDMVYWSIPVEFKYYLLIPLIGFFWLIPLSAGLKLTLLVASALACALMFPGVEAEANTLQLGYYLPVLLSGSILAAVMHLRAGRPMLPGVFRHRTARVGIDLAIGLAILGSTPPVLRAIWPAAEPTSLSAHFLGWGIFWALVMAALLTGVAPTWLKAMSHPWSRACGRWCFGIYLLHIPCLLVAKRLPLPAPACAWVGVALSVVAAAVAFRLIERPFINLGNRLR